MARIAVLGGGESGVGSAVLAKVKGFDVFLSDSGTLKDEYAETLRKWEIPFEQGGHSMESILNADEVIKSPGIPGSAEVVRSIVGAGIHVVSEIEFASRYDSARKICVTGDHLDRYDHKMENYVKAKFRLVRNLRPDDCFIFDSDDAITVGHLENIVLKAKMLPFTQQKEVEQGAFVRDGKIVVRYEDRQTEIFLSELALGGRHNIYNSMAAAIAARATGISDEVIRHSLKTFSPVEHRLEPVLDVAGVKYVNDSKATNVDAAWYALECQTRPVVWIVGGTDKGNDYSVLEELVRQKVKAIVCLGKDNSKIHAAFEGIVGSGAICDTLSAEDAVKAAARFASEGDVVLLSPCCASFDLFRNYEDRGTQFKQAVRRL